MHSLTVSITLLMVFFSSSQAFSVASPPVIKTAVASMSSTALFSNTRLNYRNTQDHEDSFTDQSVYVEASRVIPTYALPSKTNASKEAQRAGNMLDAEILVGRLAMVAAVVLIGTELVSGVSLPEQISMIM